LKEKKYENIYLISGPVLVKKFRPDLQKKFSNTLDDDTIFEYIYHCNAQTPRFVDVSCCTM